MKDVCGGRAHWARRVNEISFRPVKRTAVYALCAAMALQGCVSTTAQVRNEAGDNCAPLRAPIRAQSEAYNQRFLVNVGGGALAGAATGAGVAGARGDNVLKGALIGALVGGLAGAALAYYQNKEKQAKNERELRRLVNADITNANQNVTSLSNGIGRLNECRLTQLENVRSAVARGNKGPAQRTRLSNIRRWMDGDRALIKDAVGGVDSGTGVYQEAYAKSHDIDQQRVAPTAAAYSPVFDRPVRPRGGAAAPSQGSAYATAGVNVRSGPGTSHGKVGALSRGQRVEVLDGEAGAGWVQIRGGGITGFVSGKYLSDNQVAAARPSGSKSSSKGSLPKVVNSQKPKGTNAADALFIEAKALRASSDTQAIYLDNQVDDVAKLLDA